MSLRKIATFGLLGGGVLLLAGWGGTNPYGQKPGYPGKPKKGPGGSSTWGNVPGVDALPDFDFGGNGIYISNDCDWVIEGNLFWGPQRRAEQFDSVLGTLSAPGEPPNSIEGWLDYLILEEGVTDPLVIMERFMTEVSPLCWDVGFDQWGAGLQAWYENFLARVMDHIDSWEGSIGGIGG